MLHDMSIPWTYMDKKVHGGVFRYYEVVNLEEITTQHKVQHRQQNEQLKKSYKPQYNPHHHLHPTPTQEQSVFR